MGSFQRRRRHCFPRTTPFSGVHPSAVGFDLRNTVRFFLANAVATTAPQRAMSSVVPFIETSPSEPITVSAVMRQIIMGEGVIVVVFVFCKFVGGGGDLGVQPIIADVNYPTTVLWKNRHNCMWCWLSKLLSASRGGFPHLSGQF